MAYLKSDQNGQWYIDKTNWNFIHDALCDALAYFSEADLNHEIYIMIDHIAEDIYSKFLKK